MTPVGEGTRVVVHDADRTVGRGVISRIDQRDDRGRALRALVRLDDGTGVYLDALDARRTRWLALEVGT